MNDYQRLLKKLENSSHSNEHLKPIKTHMHSYSIGYSPLVTPSGNFETSHVRYNLLLSYFNEMLPFDMRILTSEKFFYFKFLCDYYEKLDILFFQHNEQKNVTMCFFKFKNMSALNDCIFEIYTNASTQDSSGGMFVIPGEKRQLDFKEILINVYTDNYTTFYKYKKQIEQLFKLPKKYFEYEEVKNKIYLLGSFGGSFRKSVFIIENSDKNTLDLYSEEIANSAKDVINLINNKSKGIILFHGEKGCGKTTFIKYLINNSKKEFYYVTGENASKFSSGNFLEFVSKNSKHSVFIFEDMEFLLHSRESKSNSVVSDILNAADGILSDVVNPLFIFTFNTQLNNIDTAFLRPGRLLWEQEFKYLEYSRAEKIAKEHNIILREKRNYTLAEIFALKNESSRTKTFPSENKNKIGFTYNV